MGAGGTNAALGKVLIKGAPLVVGGNVSLDGVILPHHSLAAQ